MTDCTLFHTLTFADVQRGIAFLEAVGFRKAAVYTDENDPSIVVHAQYDWRDTGGVMFGSPRERESGWQDSVGHAQCYCVVETDEEVDRVHAAALAAGATSLQEPVDQDYGGRGCAVRDHEGNQWSFGSYRGE